MLGSLMRRWFAPKQFKLAQYYNQYHDFLVHQSHNQKGVCNGLVVEYAIIFLTKGNKIDVIKQFKDKATNLSANFMERVNSYQDFYPAIRHKEYTTSIDLAKVLRDEVKTDTVLAVGLVTANLEEAGHSIAVKVMHHDLGVAYKIFDPNYGESVWYHSKLELAKAFDELKRKYSFEVYKGQKLQFSVVDLKVLLSDLGIIKPAGNYTKDSKYAYRFVEALKEQDFDKIHGDLGREVKLDSYYTMNFADKSLWSKFADLEFAPNSLMDLAILKLNEADLIKLININTQLDLSESLCSIIIFLVITEKITTNVLDALMAKLPADNHEYIKLLEDLKIEVQDPLKTNPLDDYKKEDESLIFACPKGAPTEIVIKDFAKKQNEFCGKEILYLVEENDIIELHAPIKADDSIDIG